MAKADSTVAVATEADLESLSTIVARSFHKNNVFIRETMPDTPLLRQWWFDVFRTEIRNDKCHVLTVFDSDIATTRGRFAVGVLLLVRHDPKDPQPSVFETIPLTDDHDRARFAAMTENTSDARTTHMAGQPYFEILLFGVDDRYQGTGLGTKILTEACRISAAENIGLFVQANLVAKRFYERHGFVCVEEVKLPGEDYGEAQLIFNARTTSTSNRT